MRNKFLCKLCLILTLVFAFSTSAFAQSNEVVLEDNRTLTPTGNAQLLDDVTDNENLQFITVTARDGNVFYFVIDHGAESENVYFLNVVDEADLNALIEKEETEVPEEPIEEPDAEKTDEGLEPIEDVEPEKPEGNNTGLIIILVIAVVAGIGGYYYKVILPKKKLNDADDIEDFDFGDEDDELDEDVKEAEEVYDTDDEEETE